MNRGRQTYYEMERNSNLKLLDFMKAACFNKAWDALQKSKV